VWDGDVEQSLIDSISSPGISGIKFMGTQSPEHYIRDNILADIGKDKIIEEYALTEADWITLKNMLDSLTDLHDLFHTIAAYVSGIGRIRDNIVSTKTTSAVPRRARDKKFGQRGRTAFSK